MQAVDPQVVITFMLDKKEQGVTNKYIRSCLYHWDNFLTQRQSPEIYNHPTINQAISHLLPKTKDPTPKAKAAVTIELLQFLTKHLMHQYQTQTPSIKSYLQFRDTFILNVSFFGLLRRSDMYNLTKEHLELHPSHQYAIAHITKSKTDQLSEGYSLPIILSNQHYTWHKLFYDYIHSRHTHTALLPTYNART